MSMSTPVQNLPPVSQSNMQQKVIDDPAIRDVIQEMDAEVAAASTQNQFSAPQHYVNEGAVTLQQQAAMMNYGKNNNAPKSLLNFEIAKRAIIAAIISAIIFHPMISQMLSTRLPCLSANDMYMLAARVFILAVILYILMLKLDV